MNIFPFIIHSILLALGAVYLKNRYKQTPLHSFFLPGLCLKILAGVVYGWLYVFYYGGIGDSLNYFKDAALFTSLAYQSPQDYLLFLWEDQYQPFTFSLGDLWNQPRALLTVKLISILNIYTFNNYWITGFYLSVFSFWGMWRLANALATQFPSTKYASTIAFLFFPSTILWSSGLTKESIVMGLIGFSIASVIKGLYRDSFSRTFLLKNIIIWTIATIGIWLMKYYYIACLAPCILSFYLVTNLLHILPRPWAQYYLRSRWIQCLLLFTFLGILLWGATNLHPVLSLDYFMLAIIYNHNSTYIFSQPDDLIHYSIYGGHGYITIDATLRSLSYNSLTAFFSALFRPFIWEAGTNKLKWIIGIENLFVLGASLYALYAFFRCLKAWKEPSLLIQRKTLLLTSFLLYIFILLTVLAFASPNFGGLIRYRVGAYPFYIYLILIPLNQFIKKTFSKLSFLRKPLYKVKF